MYRPSASRIRSGSGGSTESASPEKLIADIGLVGVTHGGHFPEAFENGGVMNHVLEPILRVVKKQGDDFSLLTADDVDRVLRLGLVSEDYTLKAAGYEIDLKPLIEARVASFSHGRKKPTTSARPARISTARAARLPKRGLDALKNALAQPGSDDVAANELSLRRLCIRAEILTDTPTPDADQGLRREYQVQRLMASMGQGVKADDGQLDTLAIEWLGVGPIEEPSYQQLLARFKECRRKALTSPRRKS